jgi:hypothetical protein
LVKLGQRQRCPQLEALCLLLLSDGDGSEERILRWRRVRWIAIEENFTANTVQKSIGPMFAGFAYQRQCFVNTG